jgi:hypothetical protein
MIDDPSGALRWLKQITGNNVKHLAKLRTFDCAVSSWPLSRYLLLSREYERFVLNRSCDNVCDGGTPKPIRFKPILRHKPSDVDDIVKVVRDLEKSS